MRTFLLVMLLGVVMWAGGCFRVGENLNQELNTPITDAVAHRDWVTLKQELGWRHQRSLHAWYALMPASHFDRISRADSIAILTAAGEAGLPFEPEVTPTVLENMDLDLDSVPRVFWDGVPARVQRSWLMQTVAQEALKSIARGEPAQNNSRILVLEQRLAGLRPASDSASIIGAAGMFRWGQSTTFCELGDGRTLVICDCPGVGDRYRWMRTDGTAVVVFEKSGKAREFGVLSPGSEYVGRYLAPVGVLGVREKKAGQPDITFDALAFNWGAQGVERSMVVHVGDPPNLKSGDREGDDVKMGVNPWRKTGLLMDQPESVWLDASSVLVKVAQNSPEYRVAMAATLIPMGDQGVRVEQIAMGIFWQDQTTGKVELKAVLREGK